MTPLPPADPFRELGLECSANLTNDDVRAAWRRAAAATHPDRADGGDPAAFAAAAAAYTALRTRAGRGEAMADLLAAPRSSAGHQALGTRWHRAGLKWALPRLPMKIRSGRPLVLAMRVVAVIAASGLSVFATGWQPATLAIITGAVTWLLLSGRADLAEPPA